MLLSYFLFKEADFNEQFTETRKRNSHSDSAQHFLITITQHPKATHINKEKAKWQNQLPNTESVTMLSTQNFHLFQIHADGEL